jgi:hypothetical protein
MALCRAEKYRRLWLRHFIRFALRKQLQDSLALVFHGEGLVAWGYDNEESTQEL